MVKKWNDNNISMNSSIKHRSNNKGPKYASRRIQINLDNNVLFVYVECALCKLYFNWLIRLQHIHMDLINLHSPTKTIFG